MNEIKKLKNDIEDLQDLNQKLRMEKRRLQWNIDAMKTRQSKFVGRTLQVFEMFGINPNDAMNIYVYLDRREKESNG